MSVGSDGKSLVVKTPAGEGVLQEVKVITLGSRTSAPAFFSYDKPAIESYSVTRASTGGGDVITILGTDFGTSGYAVINGKTAPSIGPPTLVTVNGVSLYQIKATIPAGMGAVNELVVRVSTLTSAPINFAYDRPTIANVKTDNASTLGGNVVFIEGYNFGTAASATIGGIPATFVSLTTIVQGTGSTADMLYQLKVLAPEGEGLGREVIVTVAGQASPSASYSYGAPKIVSIAPAKGPTSGNTSITIEGDNFGAAPIVQIGGATATFVSMTTVVRGTPAAPITRYQLVVKTPAGEGSNKQVVVRVGSQLSAPASFSYDPPTISAVSPSSGSFLGGTLVTIEGSNFGLSPIVTIGGKSATPAAVPQTHNKLVVIAPAGTGPSNAIVVTVAGQTTGASKIANFAYLNPVLTSLSPSSSTVPAGTQMTIFGSNFSAKLADNVVTLGGKPAPAVSVDPLGTKLIVTIPAGSGANNAVVAQVRGVSSNILTFTYIPMLSLLAPGANGTVTLIGTSFSPTPSRNVVTVGGKSATVVTASSTQLVVRVPAGSGANHPVVVKIDGQPSNSLSYHYVPVLTQTTPGSNGVLTIIGSNFSPTIAKNVVKVDGVPAALVSVNTAGTSLVVTVPNGWGANKSVTVSVDGMISNSLSYSYVPNLLDAKASADNQYLTLTGSYFATDLAKNSVTIGGVLAVPMSVDSTGTKLVVKIPAGQGLLKSVVASVETMQSNSLYYSYPIVLPTTVPAGVSTLLNNLVTGLQNLLNFFSRR